MDKSMCALHRRLYAALDNVEESYGLLRSGLFPDSEVCHDLLEQLALARLAVEEWQLILAGGNQSLH